MTTQSKIMPLPEPKEIPVYTVFYLTPLLSVIRKEYLGNDHEDALKQARNESDCYDVILVFIGSVPDAIWQG